MTPRGLPFLIPSGVTLQHARLYHALAECGAHVLLRGHEKTQLLGLGADASLALRSGVAPLLRECEVLHTKPETRVGSLTWPYLFPRQLTDLFRFSWAEQRKMHVSFRGLLTPAREAVLAAWRSKDGVYITGTDRGRRPETKYWDVGYAHELGSSEYVLCPDGDCPFSYRTFEAALAGAVPIVETPSSCYGTLVTLPLKDVTLETLPEWKPELAEHNYQVARSLVTADPEQLLEEVLRLRGPR